MPGNPVNLALLALTVGMAVYQARLYFLHRLSFRLAFLAFWVLLGLDLPRNNPWLLIAATACLLYGIWSRRRLAEELHRLFEGGGEADEASP
jgi:hypothetical protein